MEQDTALGKILSFMIGLFASVATVMIIQLISQVLDQHWLNMKWAFFGALTELILILIPILLIFCL